MQPSLIDTAPRFDGVDATPADTPRLGAQLARVLWVMQDGKQRSVHQVAFAVSVHFGVTDPETSISAQLRNLRKSKHGGYTVERKRIGHLSYYRLVQGEKPLVCGLCAERITGAPYIGSGGVYCEPCHTRAKGQ